MTDLVHILAATDFSPAAHDALERAAMLAAERRARLTLVHVVPAATLQSLADDVLQAVGASYPAEALGAEALERLTRLAADIAARHGVSCEARVVSGRPASCIAAMAEEGADLVVVGARGAHSTRRSAIGSSGQKVLRLSPCPVLLVRQAPEGAYRHILAPVDFSWSSRAALRAVAALFPGAALHVAHAFEHPHEGLMRYAAVEEHVIKRYSERSRAALVRELPRWASEATGPTPAPAFHVRHGHPNTVIDRLIRSLGIDLVALAAHGKSELEKTLLGSVSAHTAYAASCDVLLLTGPRFRRTAPAAG